MPRIIAADTLEILEERYAAIVRLIIVATTPVTRWCSWRTPLIIDANTYYPRNFAVSKEVAGPIAQAGGTFVFDNRDKVVSTLAYGQGFTGLTLTSVVLVKKQWEDEWAEAYIPLNAEITESSGSIRTWTLAVEVNRSLSREGGLPIGEVYCQHWFKGTWCAYVGAQVFCDRSMTTCKTGLDYDNFTRFGGFPEAPLAGAKIQVGMFITEVGAPTGALRGGRPRPIPAPHSPAAGGGLPPIPAPHSPTPGGWRPPPSSQSSPPRGNF